jgi:quinoprotein glucose dehydrogenase
MSRLIRAYTSLLLVIGLLLMGGSVYLLMLHGSSYYLLCGIAIVGSALLLWQRQGERAALYRLIVLATLRWALWEVGYEGWALMPRVATFALLGLVLLLPCARRTLGTPNVGGARSHPDWSVLYRRNPGSISARYETATGQLLWQARLPAGGMLRL